MHKNYKIYVARIEVTQSDNRLKPTSRIADNIRDGEDILTIVLMVKNTAGCLLLVVYLVFFEGLQTLPLLVRN